MKTLKSPSGAYFTERKDFTKSLFTAGGTAIGTFEKMANGILIRGQNGVPRVYAVNNRFGEKFFVSCFMEKHGLRYMFALSTKDSEWLGLNGKMSQEYEIIENWLAAIS